MSTVLKNVLRFTGLVIGVPVALPHLLNVNETPVAPRIVAPKFSGFVVTADALNVTVTRAPGGAAAVDVYVEYWHTIEAVTPPGDLIGLVPFILDGTGVSLGAVVVEDEGVPIPNTPHSILNFLGNGVTASDGGGGVADILIPGGGAGGAGATLFWGVDNIGAAIDTRFIPPGHDNGLAVTTDIFQLPAPRAGTLRNLFVRHNSTGGNGNDIVYTVLVNGVATAITATLATGAIGQASDVANTVVIAQGARVSLRATKAAIIGGGNINLMASLELG